MIKLLPLVLLLLLSVTLSAFSTTITGKVISIVGGDGITILDSNKHEHIIRLYGIDCPESGQAFGKSATKYTASLIAQKKVTVKPYDTDRYDHIVGGVMVEGVNVNESLIRAGYAWQYRKYCKASFCRDWLQLEREARVSMRGLWNFVDDPVPPWEWRNVHKSNTFNKIAL